jgi:hypothetical protein
MIATWLPSPGREVDLDTLERAMPASSCFSQSSNVNIGMMRKAIIDHCPID